MAAARNRLVVTPRTNSSPRPRNRMVTHSWMAMARLGPRIATYIAGPLSRPRGMAQLKPKKKTTKKPKNPKNPKTKNQTTNQKTKTTTKKHKTKEPDEKKGQPDI